MGIGIGKHGSLETAKKNPIANVGEKVILKRFLIQEEISLRRQVIVLNLLLTGLMLIIQLFQT